MLVYFSALVLGVTFIYYILSINYHAVILCIQNGSCEILYLKRFLYSISISLLVIIWGLKRKSIDRSGAIAAFMVGIILTYSSYCFMACCLMFFFTSSKATHFRSKKKKKLEENFKEGGQRNWIQVLCNGGPATEIALIYLLRGNIGELLLDFENNYECSWLIVALVSSLASGNADTWASEIGPVVSKMEPRLITSFHKVPMGTNGAITIAGLISSALGGLVIGLAYFMALLISHENLLIMTHQAILLLFIGLVAGLFGSVLDSVIGATLQYSGIDIRTGKIVEHPGAGIKHISGKYLLDNHSVNLIMTVVTSLVVPSITSKLYPFFI